MIIAEKSVVTQYSIFVFICAYSLSFVFGILFTGNRWFTWKQKKINQIICIIRKGFVVLPWAVLCGLRGTNVGYDTQNYYDNYFNIGSYSGWDFERMLRSPLYYIINKIVYKVDSNSARLIFFSIAFITLYFVLSSIMIVTDKSYLVSCGYMFFLLMFGPRMMDQARQFIAVATVMYAFSVLSRGNRNKFIFYMIIGTLFHSSCIIFIVFGFLSLDETHRKKIASIVILGTIISTATIKYILKAIYMLLPSHYEYIREQGHESTGFGLGGLADLIPIVLFIYVYYWNNRNSENELSLVSLEACCATALPFRFAGYSSFFILRLYYYGAVISILLNIFCLNQRKTYGKKNWFLLSIEMLMAGVYCYVLYFSLNYSMVLPYYISSS